ncbi:MAG: DUF3267 domain-containing protein [Bulleidia sp.]
MPQEIKDPTRKLSPREAQRAAAFEQICRDMESKGYQKKELTVSVKEANISGLLTVLPDIICLLLLFLIFTPKAQLVVTEIQFVSLPFVLLALIVIHEMIHGFVWGLCLEKKFAGIEFGVIWKLLTPYCTCCRPLTKTAYLVGLAMPTTLLGYTPAICGIYTGNLYMFLIGLIMITGGAGDRLIQKRILQSGIRDALCLDHPYECGVVLFFR